jgi:DNA-binding PadR family transcriptional regulator
MNGYKIQRALIEELGRRFSFGTLYPRLRVLESQRLLEVAYTKLWPGSIAVAPNQEESAKARVVKRVFRLTELGRERARRGVEDMQDMTKKLEEITASKTRERIVEPTQSEEELVWLTRQPPFLFPLRLACISGKPARFFPREGQRRNSREGRSQSKRGGRSGRELLK